MKKGYRRRYREIVKRGCGGYKDYWGDYDCRHEYDWTCDSCPCCIEAMKHPIETVEELIDFVGWFTQTKEENE